ncbi:MAG: FUSC family protein [Solirubrobacterales bacterium]|nr:FUSC family protein [Solirubrobacterales bacterium]
MPPREILETAAERSRTGFRARVDRLLALRRTLLQASLSAGVAWAIATEAVGHPKPFFAPVAAMIVLGLTVGQRLTRAIEVALGVTLGIVLGDLLVLAIGSGAWQLVAVTLLAMSITVLLGGSPLLVQQTAVSAALVVTLQPPTGGLSFARSVDGLIGCAVALVLSYLVLPVDPLRLVRREAEPVLRELAGVLDDIAAALAGGTLEDAERALERARAIDVHAQRFSEALVIGRQTAVAAPSRRRERSAVELYADAGVQLDLAVRNVRVLARGAIRALDVGDRVPPQVPEAIRQLGEAVASLRPWLRAGGDRGARADEQPVGERHHRPGALDRGRPPPGHGAAAGGGARAGARRDDRALTATGRAADRRDPSGRGGRGRRGRPGRRRACCPARP